MTISRVLLVVAVVLFAFVVAGVGLGALDLLALGLAFFAASFLT